MHPLCLGVTFLCHLLFQLLTALFSHGNQLVPVSVMRVHLLKKFKVVLSKPLDALAGCV